MDRNTILADFQACSGISDVAFCFSLLEANNWDLTAALKSAVKDGVSEVEMDVEQLFPNSPSEPPGEFLDVHESTSSVRPNSSNPPTRSRTSPIPFHSTHSPAPSSEPTVVAPQAVVTSDRTLLEKDTGPVASCGRVRILKFEIRLELPSDCGMPDSCSECFTFPETETVGSLKRHFIQRRLTELILVATSPEWSEHIKEVNPNTLLAHLQFDQSGRYSFDNDSVVLRSLHLPTFNTITAKLVKVNPAEAQTSSEQSSRVRDMSGYIELHIHVCTASPGDPSSSVYDGGGSVKTMHVLRLQPSWTVTQLRCDVHSLTGISITHQLWSVLPPDGLAEPNASGRGTAGLKRLVSLLNRHAQSSSPGPSAHSRAARSTSPHNPSLEQLGLQTGQTYTLYVRQSDHETTTASAPSVADQPCPSRTEATASTHTTTANAKRAATRTSMHGKLSDEHISDIDDDFDEDDFDNVMDDFDLVEEPKSNLWTDPLIPESHFAEDPSEATEKFCQLFLQRYCGDEATMPPPFATCSLEMAVASTVSTASVSQRKPLFIYLHHNDSVACHVFCQQIICSPGLGQFLGDHGFCLWPWDVTRPRARERLLGWLENTIPKLASVVTPLAVDSYPVLAMVGKVAGQLEVLYVVLGTGAVASPTVLTTDEVNFPSLSTTGSTVLGKRSTGSQSTAAGSLKPDVIVAELWQAYTNYMELLVPELEAEAARVARQQVRAEQEAAYLESLRQDQLKAKERARAEEQERLERERLARQRDKQQSEAAQLRLTMAASLPREPPAPNTPNAQVFLARPEGAAGIASLRFRLPRSATAGSDSNQKTLHRRFAGLDKLRTLLNYMESEGFPVSEYKLLTTYPRRDLTTLDKDATLADLKLVPQETLTLEQR